MRVAASLSRLRNVQFAGGRTEPACIPCRAEVVPKPPGKENTRRRGKRAVASRSKNAGNVETSRYYRTAFRFFAVLPRRGFHSTVDWQIIHSSLRKKSTSKLYTHTTDNEFSSCTGTGRGDRTTAAPTVNGNQSV